MEPRYKDVREAVYRLKHIQFLLNNTCEENGGEVTEETMELEEMKETVLFILENGGIDKLARLLNSVKADIDQYKAEQDFIKRQQKKSEDFQEDILECINVAMEQLGEEKIKSSFGYSFSQHVASSTKPDTKLIKELFYEDVERVIREAGVCPEHITFTLSASSSKLKEGEEMPDYFTTTSRARATFRKPRKADDTPEEFPTSIFENNL